MSRIYTIEDLDTYLREIIGVSIIVPPDDDCEYRIERLSHVSRGEIEKDLSTNDDSDAWLQSLGVEKWQDAREHDLLLYFILHVTGVSIWKQKTLVEKDGVIEEKMVETFDASCAAEIVE